MMPGPEGADFNNSREGITTLERIRFRRIGLMGISLVLSALAWGQGLPNGGLQFSQNITIPGWGATGSAGNASVDLMGYNPVTRMMYLADKKNIKIDVIDT